MHGSACTWRACRNGGKVANAIEGNVCISKYPALERNDDDDSTISRPGAATEFGWKVQGHCTSVLIDLDMCNVTCFEWIELLKGTCDGNPVPESTTLLLYVDTADDKG